MEVIQTPSCPVQLLSQFSERSWRKIEGTYEFQSVGVVLFDVLHDVPVVHPFRHGDELTFLHVPLNPNKSQDVRMG